MSPAFLIKMGLLGFHLQSQCFPFLAPTQDQLGIWIESPEAAGWGKKSVLGHSSWMRLFLSVVEPVFLVLCSRIFWTSPAPSQTSRALLPPIKLLSHQLPRFMNFAYHEVSCFILPHLWEELSWLVPFHSLMLCWASGFHGLETLVSRAFSFGSWKDSRAAFRHRIYHCHGPFYFTYGCYILQYIQLDIKY